MENKQGSITSQAAKTAAPQNLTSSPQVKPEPSLVKPLTSKKAAKAKIFTLIASFLVVVLGITTGWFLAGNKTKTTGSGGSNQVKSANGQVQEAGIGDPSSYASTVDGILKKGGIKGEGTHYIDRGLGESKYVYLTSSVVDLDSFVDKKVTVWGDTISAKYAPWLIDVGKIKVSQ